MSGQKRKPSAPARTAAWAFALLLTIALTGTLISHSCVRILMSEDLHVSSATDDKVVADQMERLSDAIRELSAEYYFDAGQVIAALDREEVIRADRETAVWWTRITAEGIMDDEIPAWSADSLLPVIEESLTAEKIPEGQDSAEMTHFSTSLEDPEAFLDETRKTFQNTWTAHDGETVTMRYPADKEKAWTSLC